MTTATGVAALGIALLVLTACGGRDESGAPSPPVVPPADVFLSLPGNHGLAAGEITLAPGTSQEQGNVVLSCPAGGPACVVTVMADGTATYHRTGGMPGVAPAEGGTDPYDGPYDPSGPVVGVASSEHSRNNPSAEDLLDHWNDPQTLRSALRLSAVGRRHVGERRRYLETLLHRAGGSSGGTGTRFRNVRPEDVDIIGERNGIVYGQWKGGPAGTLDIEFDYRFIRGHDTAAVRAAMEREGKLWTRRLRDSFDELVIPRGTTINRDVPPSLGILAEDMAVDDIVIFLDRFDAEFLAFAILWNQEESGDDFRPRAGTIVYSNGAFTRRAARLGHDTDRFGELSHEIGHILGVGAEAPSIERYVNRRDATFEGPASMAANDGEPVPFQPLAPNPDGSPHIDYAHFGVCNSIVSNHYGCAFGPPRFPEVPRGPTEIDFAFLEDIGYEVLDPATASEPEVYGLGAWGRYSAWGAGVERTFGLEDGGKRFHDRLRAGADAFGISPGANLADSLAPRGTATWSGSLIGVDLGQGMLPPVFGEAELEVDLSTLGGTIRFSNLTVFVGNQPGAFRSPGLEYDVRVSANSFSDPDNRLRGGFFGPAHEEMAGVLDDRRSHVNLIAGFGGRR